MDREKKIILCDADDVIENLIDCWISAINQRYGTTVKPSEVTDWDVSLFFLTLTKEQVFAPIKEKDIWSNLERIPDCFEVLKEINDTQSCPSTVEVESGKIGFMNLVYIYSTIISNSSINNGLLSGVYIKPWKEIVA